MIRGRTLLRNRVSTHRWSSLVSVLDLDDQRREYHNRSSPGKFDTLIFGNSRRSTIYKHSNNLFSNNLTALQSSYSSSNTMHSITSSLTSSTTVRLFQSTPTRRKKSTTPKKSEKKTNNSVPAWLKEDETPTHTVVLNFLKSVPGQVGNMTLRFLKWIVKCIKDPTHFNETFSEIWQHTKHEFQRYKTGTKLLVADVQLATNIIRRVLQGYSLSRRERKQLKRTAIDILRVGPLAMFIIIPGMELALPFAIRLFPNMLPTTFRETLKTQEDKKRLLRARIEMTTFFQSTMRDFAEESKTKARRRQDQMRRLAAERKENRKEEGDEEEDGEDIKNKSNNDINDVDEEVEKSINLELNRASRLMDAIDKVREGAIVDTKTIIEMAQLFKDGITLDTVSRSHLVAMCKYMGLNAFGSDPYLRFQLRSAIRDIRNDDQSILWEGPESLSTEELKAACEERGMRASGLSRDEYLTQLQHWLDMSVNKNVPLTLLVMSRAFLFTTSDPSAQDETAALQEAVSQLDEDVIVDAVIEAAESSAAMSATPMDAEEAAKEMEVLSQLKLERLERQRELIEEEREEAAEIEQEKREAEEAEEAEEREEAEEMLEKFPEVADTATVLTSSSGDAKTYIEDKAFRKSKTQEKKNINKQQQSNIVTKKKDEKRYTEEGTVLKVGGMQLVLSKAEIEALESLATNSAVVAERSLLEKLKLLKREAEIADILAEGRNMEKENEYEEEQEKQEQQEQQEKQEKQEIQDKKDLVEQNKESQKIKTLNELEEELDAEIEEESTITKIKESIPSLEELKESASKMADDMTSTEPEEEDEEEEALILLQKEEEAEADVLRRGRNRLEKMILRLEAEVEEADQEIGTSLNLLDQNHDGICTTEELRNAYTKVLKEDDTSKADALIVRVDPKGKGYFKIADLHNLLEGLEGDDPDMEIFEFLAEKEIKSSD